MNFFKNIISFLKNIFTKRKTVKMIEQSKVESCLIDKSNFVNSLKITIVKPGNPDIETLTCIGDGLGIQPKISF